MVYVLEGIEEYKRDYEIKKIVNGRPAQFFYEWDDEVRNCWMTPGFLGSSVVVLELAQLKADPALEKALEHPGSENDLIISFPKGQKNLKVYKAMSKHGKYIPCGKLDCGKLQKYIFQALQTLGSSMDDEVYQYFVDYSQYYERDEITLYTINVYLKQLSFAQSEITKNTVQQLLPRWREDDIMRLSVLLFSKDRKNFMCLVSDLMLGKCEPIGLLGLLLRNFRIAYKISLYPEMDEDELRRLLGLNWRQMQSIKGVRGYTIETVKTCIGIIQSTVRDIKGGMLGGETAFIISMGKLLDEIL